MKRFFCVLSLTIFAFAGFAGVAVAEAEENRAYFPPVLMYHDLKPIPLNTFDVTPDDFCQQLDWLQENGYETLSMEEFVSYVQQGSDFPEKSVVITFDDGYRGIYTYAMPELRKRGMKATFFLIADNIGKHDTRYPRATKEDIKEMAQEPLITIGSHTRTHPHLDKLTEEQRLEELVGAKRILEALTGKPINTLAYPYGDYDRAVIESTKAAGYDVAFAVNDRGLLDEPARYSIPRIYMGLALGEDNQKLFKEFVTNYKKMPPEAFAERWANLDSPE